MHLFVGNDIGNSEQKLIINSNMIKQPSVHCKITKLPNLEELNSEYISQNIYDNLIVTIESSRFNSGVPVTYYIGNYAIKTGRILKNIEVGAINSKIDSDIPFVNTLALIAGYVLKNSKSQSTNKPLVADIDMSTGLPVTQYNKINAKKLSEKFLGSHLITIYLGSKKVKVNLTFNYIKILPEAVPTIFYLKSIDDKTKKEILEKSIDLDFNNKRILHIAIGEGTTEYPITDDIRFDPHFITGSNNGIGHAINEVLQSFIQQKSLSKLSRQEFTRILLNKGHKYYPDAFDILQEPLEEQANVIVDITKQEISKANNEIDYILIYGGGSIFLKPYIKEAIKDFANKTDIKLLYVNETHATILEALGMYLFTTSDLFKSLKENFLKQS